MLVLWQRAARLGAHALGRRVRCPKLWVIRFDLLKLPEQLIVFGIRERRLVEHEVIVPRAIDHGPELGGAVRRRPRGGNAPFASVAMTCIACMATMTIRSSSSSDSFGSSVSAQ